MIFVNKSLDISTTKATTRQVANMVMPALKEVLTADEIEDMEADIKFFGDWDLTEVPLEAFNLITRTLESADWGELAELKLPLMEKLKTDKRFLKQ